MESWASTCLILCIFGFLKDFKPSEPFLTQYLITPKWVNITLDEAYQDVYPVWTYSYLAVLIFVFLLTDYVKYKPMIIFEGLAFIATWVLLVFATGVQWMQVPNIFLYKLALDLNLVYSSLCNLPMVLQHQPKLHIIHTFMQKWMQTSTSKSPLSLE